MLTIVMIQWMLNSKLKAIRWLPRSSRQLRRSSRLILAIIVIPIELENSLPLMVLVVKGSMQMATNCKMPMIIEINPLRALPNLMI